MKKTVAKKAITAKPRESSEAGPVPMDPDSPDRTSTASAPFSRRRCYALETLVSEVEGLFPETPHEVSAYNGRQVALDALFDLTALDESDASLLITLLQLCDSDPRVASVTVEDGQALVSFYNSARTYDSRDSFSLDAAFSVLVEGSL